ncbi:MAG TPA: response regulator [Phototrophicaceae bacterium]|nr:response regulator [Phototrophicaceae bacterium]
MSDKPRLLIVEDDPDLSDMLDAYFRVQEYDVLTAAWGRDALKISAEETVNLIMLDIRLPDIDGYEICRQLRTQRRTQDVPIIFLTEKRDRVDKLQGLELGVVDYITKPFDVQELRLRVRNAISRVEQAALVNPVTELPETPVLDDHLNALLYTERHWALLLLAIGGLNKLRELYGFVAADEMLRAVTLMIRNAVREFGSEDDLIAHLSAEAFVILTSAEKVGSLRERIETRVRSSLIHFYRPKEVENAEANFLTLETGVIDYRTQFNDAESARQALAATIAPPE